MEQFPYVNVVCMITKGTVKCVKVECMITKGTICMCKSGIHIINFWSQCTDKNNYIQQLFGCFSKTTNDTIMFQIWTLEGSNPFIQFMGLTYGWYPSVTVQFCEVNIKRRRNFFYNVHFLYELIQSNVTVSSPTFKKITWNNVYLK